MALQEKNQIRVINRTMTKEILLNWLPIILVAVTSTFISCLKFLKFHRTKYRYAFRSNWSKIIIVANCVVSILAYLYFKSTGVKVIPMLENDFYNFLIIAFLSPFIVNGVVTWWPIRNKSQDVSKQTVNLFVWINETIEPEIERFVDQKVAEIVSKIDNSRENIEKLRTFGESLLYVKKFPTEEDRSSKLAKLYELAQEKILAGIIGLLLEYCSAVWLERQINKKNI